ncbi:hypothetical protein Sgleb_54140 [Streptomyces glebosus]|uniref:Ricin B lectin domain-containing protein n=1 Tax=Streptomyces glebosus TaxID=249580 RepID=A0A640T0V6_9ACTN|nr:hypothetical protein [Streptomyces glebosus]GFE17367.1 hypothetical protein Sgleb_54140 [Streptomyces glebosus]GHG83880.1 hypothetical protein GCM10010513_63640 [Streptomyces glebosus]
MKMRRNAGRTLAMGAMAASLLILGTGAANAATGTLEFSGNGERTLTNPTDGACYKLAKSSPTGSRGYKTITNHTNKKVTWYTTDNCQGDGSAVAPGETSEASGTWWPFVSIRYVKIG